MAMRRGETLALAFHPSLVAERRADMEKRS